MTIRKNGRSAKMTEAAVRLMHEQRRIQKPGWTVRQIANYHGMSENQTQRILLGGAWKDIWREYEGVGETPPSTAELDTPAARAAAEAYERDFLKPQMEKHLAEQATSNGILEAPPKGPDELDRCPDCQERIKEVLGRWSHAPYCREKDWRPSI